MRADNARIKFRLRQATIAKQYSLATTTKSARPNKSLSGHLGNRSADACTAY